MKRRRLCALDFATLCAWCFLSAGIAAAQGTDSNRDSIANRYLAWTLGTELAGAVLAWGQGLPASEAEEYIERVRPAARVFGATIPPLPQRKASEAEDLAAAMHYLLETAGNEIGVPIRLRESEAHAFLFEIAVKSTILMVIYAPRDDIGLAIASVIRDRAPRAGIPAEYWLPLVERVESGVSAERVSSTVRDMQRDIGRLLFESL